MDVDKLTPCSLSLPPSRPSTSYYTASDRDCHWSAEAHPLSGVESLRRRTARDVQLDDTGRRWLTMVIPYNSCCRCLMPPLATCCRILMPLLLVLADQEYAGLWRSHLRNHDPHEGRCFWCSVPFVSETDQRPKTSTLHHAHPMDSSWDPGSNTNQAQIDRASIQI
jgi:hypothetical protein